LVDQLNTGGIGNIAPLATHNSHVAFMALAGGKWINMRLSYPLGLSTNRIDIRTRAGRVHHRALSIHAWSRTDPASLFECPILANVGIMGLR
jgi:hypothetical protein